MKKITKTSVVLAIGVMTGAMGAWASSSDMNSGNSSPQKETAMQKIENGTDKAARTTVHESKKLAHATVRDSREIAHATVRESKSFASSAWDESKRIGRTAIDSPVIAWQVLRGERQLFPKENASTGSDTGRRQIAFGGHRKTASNTGRSTQ